VSRYINAFDEDTILKVVISFLVDGMSHRNIQKQILGLPAPARGGGFIAMDILHYFGIDGNKKGALKQRNIEDELKYSQGEYKKVLKKIKEYFNAEQEVINNIENSFFLINTNSTELTSQTKIRINQSVLRKYVLDNYSHQCALCEINKSDLLICSHIKPWAIDAENRLNPCNAICFCVLHDRLFDKGYFSLDENYQIIFSSKADKSIRDLLLGLKFKVPTKNPPDPEFLRYHYNEICN
jgi:putative restriction endonuclease